MDIMYAQMGMGLIGGLAEIGTAKTEAKLAQMTQKYQNTMADISKAQSLNVLTDNEISFRDSVVHTKKAMELASLQDKSAAAVSAATAGVDGGSARAVLRGLTRSRLSAVSALDKSVTAQRRAFVNERRNVEVASIYGKDISVIPRPSTASSLLGLAAGMIDIYDKNQPEGSKTTDTIASWFK